jgi:hypothetical protein
MLYLTKLYLYIIFAYLKGLQILFVKAQKIHITHRHLNRVKCDIV